MRQAQTEVVCLARDSAEPRRLFPQPMVDFAFARGGCGRRLVVFPLSWRSGERCGANGRKQSRKWRDSQSSAAVPVVVATAHRGDLPVYFNGLGTVTAFNTVTVRSRVDGQIVKINFTEGQNVKEGDALIEIDPRPYQVQLEQAEGQLAKDQAQLKDMQVDYERYQLLFKEGVIPKQQLDTQQAQVGHV